MKEIAAGVEVASAFPEPICRICPRSVPPMTPHPPLTPRGYLFIPKFPVKIYA